MKVLQVVGFKKSGKTSLINRWVKLCKDQSMSVVTIKHHGHNSPLELPDKQTDSMQHFQHGADSTIVYGGHVLQIHQRVPKEPTLQQLIDFAANNNPDIIFVEGYKQEDYPKVVVFNHTDEWKMLSKLSNIELTITSDTVKLANEKYLHKENRTLVDSWLLNWLEG